MRKLCEWKSVRILEAECCADHIHMLVEIPPKMSVSGFMGYLKGKSSLMLYEQFGDLKFKYRNREFWCSPNVDVRAVKPRKPKDGESLACATAELVRGAVAETLKYSTKPADMVADPEWFLELPVFVSSLQYLSGNPSHQL